MTIYKYDIHTHTSEVSPCGKVEAEKVVELYKEAGYTGIVITDHYYEGFFENGGIVRVTENTHQSLVKVYL